MTQELRDNSVLARKNVMVFTVCVGVFVLWALITYFRIPEPAIIVSYPEMASVMMDEPDLVARYGKVVGSTKNILSSRDIFSMVEEKSYEPPILVDSIVHDQLYFIYQGNLVRASGEMIVQINSSERTFFVTEGEMVLDWRIASIDGTQVVLDGPSRLLLPLRERVFAREPYAMVTVCATGEKRKVIVGTAINREDKILDIEEDNIILETRQGRVSVYK